MLHSGRSCYGGGQLRYKDIKAPVRERSFDRESWAALDKVKFDVHVYGGCWAIGGPFYFGKAFEDPPFFTYSAVSRVEIEGFAAIPVFNFTCGVERWIIDPQKVFIGAYVWFQSLEFFQGDIGFGGGYVDLDVVLSWEGMTYKGYFPAYPNTQEKSGPEAVSIICPVET